MIHGRFTFKILLSVFILGLFVSGPVQAYTYGNWNIDGYVKSQFGVFTEGKPFNDADNGITGYTRTGLASATNVFLAKPGSDDNIATARQQMRWNLNGQLTDSVSLRAEILGAWEPDYPGEKGTEEGGYKYIPANFYSSFDWRELTLEYKPTFAHTLRFGRQIINWGEALSGRVADQTNPVDSRYLLGFTNLEETYMPLWMFRGIHDFYDWNTNIEWIAAPIWQANRYEHARSMTTTGQRYGDGSMGTPWYRFGANPEGRVNRLGGADIAISGKDFTPTRIYGPPFDAMYRVLPRASAAFALGLPVNAYPGMDTFAVAVTRPITDGSIDPNYNEDYTDHNFKNTRWGIKSKHMLWGADVGLSFYQGPSDTGNYHFRYSTTVDGSPYLIYERVVPRYNTFGLFGNYQLPWAVMIFEGAYKPNREYHKSLLGTTTDAQRIDNVARRDIIHTMLGATREQNIPLLNRDNVFTIRAQWQAMYYLQDMDDLAEITTYFNEAPQMDNEIMISISTAYSYRKYTPSVTLVMNPRGQVYSSFNYLWVVGGFNDRLNVSLGYTNIWGANDYSTRTVLAAKNDLAVLTVQYNFY